MQVLKGLIRETRGNALWDLLKAVVYLTGFWLIQRFRGAPVDLVGLTIAFVVLVIFSLVVAYLQSIPIPQSTVTVPAIRPSSDNERLSDRTELEIRFEPGDSRYSAFPKFRIGIYNCGEQVARRVEAILEAVFPNDYAVPFEDQLPHPFRTRDGNQTNCEINPDREALFQFVTSSRGRDDEALEFVIDGIRGDPAKNRNADSPNIVLLPRECFHLYIRVCCANADSRTAVFFAQRWYGTIAVSRIC